MTAVMTSLFDLVIFFQVLSLVSYFHVLAALHYSGKNFWTKGDDIEDRQILSVYPDAKPPGSDDNDGKLQLHDRCV